MIKFYFTTLYVEGCPGSNFLLCHIIVFIISPDKIWGYTGFMSCHTAVTIHVDLCVEELKNAFIDFIQTWHTHVFGSAGKPYFNVTINSQ